MSGLRDQFPQTIYKLDASDTATDSTRLFSSFVCTVAGDVTFKGYGMSKLFAAGDADSSTYDDIKYIISPLSAINTSILGSIETNTTDGDAVTNLLLIPTTDGYGTGGQIAITIAGGVVTAAAVKVIGKDYRPGDTLTVSKDLIGGSTDVTFKLQRADLDIVAGAYEVKSTVATTLALKAGMTIYGKFLSVATDGTAKGIAYVGGTK